MKFQCLDKCLATVYVFKCLDIPRYSIYNAIKLRKLGRRNRWNQRISSRFALHFHRVMTNYSGWSLQSFEGISPQGNDKKENPWPYTCPSLTLKLISHRVFFLYIFFVTRRLHKTPALRGKGESEEEVTTLMRTDGEEGERGVVTLLRPTKAERKFQIKHVSYLHPSSFLLPPWSCLMFSFQHQIDVNAAESDPWTLLCSAFSNRRRKQRRAVGAGGGGI